MAKISPSQLSREIAESLASNVKTATRRLPAGPLDGAALAEALPAYKGWTPAWEYPGFLAFHRGGLSVLCTPDYHRPGTIAIDVQRSDGTSIGGGRDLAWPMAKRTPASFMKLMRPVLDAAGTARVSKTDRLRLGATLRRVIKEDRKAAGHRPLRHDDYQRAAEQAIKICGLYGRTAAQAGDDGVEIFEIVNGEPDVDQGAFVRYSDDD